MKLMDALNRIERAGQEDSKATIKLKEAVGIVAAEILSKILKDAEIDDWKWVEREYMECYDSEVDGRFLNLTADTYLFARRLTSCWSVDFLVRIATDNYNRDEYLANAPVWDGYMLDPTRGNNPATIERWRNENRVGKPKLEISRHAALKFAFLAAQNLFEQIANELEKRAQKATDAVVTVDTVKQ